MADEKFRMECENMFGRNLKRIEKLEKITNAQVTVNSHHSKGYNSLEDVLRKLGYDYVKHMKEEHSYIIPLNVEKALEKLDSTKKEIPSECLRTCCECQKIFESIELRKEHERIIHGLRFDIEKRPELIKACSTCKFNFARSFACETCNTGFTNYAPIDSGKKEYIASLNDPKAFEAVNLGVLKRERKAPGGEKEEGIARILKGIPVKANASGSSDSKLHEPIDPCISCPDNDICEEECELSKDAKKEYQKYEKVMREEEKDDYDKEGIRYKLSKMGIIIGRPDIYGIEETENYVKLQFQGTIEIKKEVLK